MGCRVDWLARDSSTTSICIVWDKVDVHMVSYNHVCGGRGNAAT